MPLLESLAKVTEPESIPRLLGALNVSRWRALWRSRAHVPALMRREFWRIWPPLGAIFDISDPSREAEERVHYHLALDRSPRRGPSGWGEVVGHLASGRFTPRTSQFALPAPGTAFERALAADLALLRANSQPACPDFAQVQGRIATTLGWDIVSLRVPAGVAGFELLPAASLAYACWDRLIARGGVIDRETARCSALLANLVPNLFAHDLCMAEAVLARTFGGFQ